MAASLDGETAALSRNSSSGFGIVDLLRDSSYALRDNSYDLGDPKAPLEINNDIDPLSEPFSPSTKLSRQQTVPCELGCCCPYMWEVINGPSNILGMTPDSMSAILHNNREAPFPIRRNGKIKIEKLENILSRVFEEMATTSKIAFWPAWIRIFRRSMSIVPAIILGALQRSSFKHISWIDDQKRGQVLIHRQMVFLALIVQAFALMDKFRLEYTPGPLLHIGSEFDRWFLKEVLHPRKIEPFYETFYILELSSALVDTGTDVDLGQGVLMAMKISDGTTTVTI